MDSLSQASCSLSAVGSESTIADNDQLFLLYFIIGNYFGPDIKGEVPHKSIFQRAAEGLPVYTVDQLTGSYIKTKEMEQIYHYVLRKAEKCFAVKLPLLQRFFLGNLPTSGTASYPQFPDMFPTQLHPQSLLENRYKIVSNIIFVNNPGTSHMGSEDIERFKRLTGLENLLLDRDAARFYSYLDDGKNLYDVVAHETGPGVEWPPVSAHHFRSVADSMQSSHQDVQNAANMPSKEQHAQNVAPLNGVSCIDLPLNHSCSIPLPTRDDRKSVSNGPGMIVLPSHPRREGWRVMMAESKEGFELTCTATMGQVGHIVGLVDIGECDDAYLFRVSLPGVRKDDNDFSCNIEASGKVLIKVVTTTGEKTVYRFSQKFEMQSQNLCLPGQFSLAFQLPGPVNPDQFSGNFGTDGILEAVVMKSKQTS